MRVLLLDNRDSFVWNLAQAFGVLGCTVDVLRSDAVATVDELAAHRFDVLAISPGPGRPEDAGISVAAIRALSGRVPILGVCLGHQAIGAAFGAVVDRCPPCHGKAWPIHHAAAAPFAHLPSPFAACRYHSLAVARAGLPAVLRPLAHTAEGILMAMRHEAHPTLGLQFHPESFRSPDGPSILQSFLHGFAMETS
ncbi:MAG: aminodeoxychorismate/anthranilate synthase component II [Planctomycetes bacterium]|nr:aminodeoxychorismate/anthranilate synthase component II [Planctomycetota bacterium]